MTIGPLLMAVAFLRSVTTLTGGGPAALDGVRTITGPVPKLYVVVIDGSSQLWRLQTGADAENVSGGVVRPDDYSDAIQKVFKRIG